MPEERAERAHAERAGGLHELALTDAEDLRVDARAIHTQFTGAMTSATIHRLGRGMAARAMARMRAGKAVMTSVGA